MRNFFTQDIGWKIFSLLLAMAIWFTVDTLRKEGAPAGQAGDWVTYTTTNLPVFVVSAASEVHEFKVIPDMVRVTVRGRPEVMSALNEEEIRVTVDLTRLEGAPDLQNAPAVASPKESSSVPPLHLRKRVNVSAPPGITFVRTTPPEVEVIMTPKRDISK